LRCSPFASLSATWKYGLAQNQPAKEVPVVAAVNLEKLDVISGSIERRDFKHSLCFIVGDFDRFASSHRQEIGLTSFLSETFKTSEKLVITRYEIQLTVG
jgi:hypothetical protein